MSLREGLRRMHLDHGRPPRLRGHRFLCIHRHSVGFRVYEKNPSATFKYNSRNSIYPKIDVVLESPSLLLTSQSTSAILDFVKLDEGLEELRVGFALMEIATEEGRHLFEAVQTASTDHVKQFSGGERDGRGLDGARAIVKRADQP